MKHEFRRRALRRVHLGASLLALLLLVSFWCATAYAELRLDAAGIFFVKRSILLGLALLVPALISAGATGRLLCGRKPARLAARKLARMKVIAANGVLVLVPCAIALYRLSEHPPYERAFYAVQALELAAGAVNVALLLANARDGLLLSGRRVRPLRPT